MKPRLLWIGDAIAPTGFSRATHEILDVLRHTFDPYVLGINYRGDPHGYPYPIWAASAGGDYLGVDRLIWMCDTVKPDLIVLLTDPWQVPPYLERLALFPAYKDVPVVASLAVDGLNCAGLGLNGLAHAVFWTQFGLDQARLGGYTGPASVVPLGVDLETYHPMNRRMAREARFSNQYGDHFVVGNVNRNQTRKRLDLTIRYFAEWEKSSGAKDALLYLHVAPTGEEGYDVKQLAEYYGVKEFALMLPQKWYGIHERQMVETYNSFDVQVTTTQGEGFGLTTFEGMACGVPQVVPAWSALGELTQGAAKLVPCTSTATTPNGINVIGGVADEAAFIAALDDLYKDHEERRRVALAGFARASEARFRWENVGLAMLEVVQQVVEKVAI